MLTSPRAQDERHSGRPVRGLKVLLTNHALGARFGTEMYVRDLAIALLRRALYAEALAEHRQRAPLTAIEERRAAAAYLRLLSMKPNPPPPAPASRCFRRITNGAEDDISVKFRLSVVERPDKPVLEVRVGDL